MKAMKAVMFAALVCGLVALCSTGAWAQKPQFVYVNDDPFSAPNTVEGFSVNTTTGVLTPLPGSPFSTCSGCTNNLGGGGGYYASSKATIRLIHPGTSVNCLFVTNGGSNTFSVLVINPATGIPAAKKLGPFPDGGTSSGLGMAAAVSPNGKFLYIANAGSNNISAFSIGPQCAPAKIAGSPFATADGGSPDGILVSGDSKVVMTAEPSSFSVTAYNINADGSLSGGMVNAASGSAAGIDEDCKSGNIYVADASFNVTVEGFSRSGTTLSPIAGSPFNFFFSSSNSNGIVVERLGGNAFVSNQTGATVTSLAIDPATGGLTNNTGSPFLDGNPSSDQPSALSLDPFETNLFTGDFNLNFVGAGVGSLLVTGGTLTQAPGSPFVTATNSVPLSVVAFPGKLPCRAK